jgi:desampylase
MEMALQIARHVLEGLREQSLLAHPLEACGLLFGDERLISGFETTANVALDPDKGFEIDPKALFVAIRAERAGGPQLIGYWHSHPNGRVEPSQRDLDAAQDDGKIWVIVADDDIAAWQAHISDLLDTPEHGVAEVDGEWVPVINYVSSGKTIKDFWHLPLDTGEIRHLIPRDKCDEDIVPLIAKAGYPAIAPILDELMPWTADPNWPVAPPLIDYLATIGAPMVEPIRRVLRSDDDGHKFVCLRGMVRLLPPTALALLKDDLAALARIPTQGHWETSVDNEARAILDSMAV